MKFTHTRQYKVLPVLSSLSMAQELLIEALFYDLYIFKEENAKRVGK
jgi:hypothetical protein